MATATLIPVEHYLGSSYHPDCDFLDGELLERNRGERNAERSHARLQMKSAAWLFSNERRFHVCALPEVRVRITPNRVRIPDIALISDSAPFAQVVVTAPVLCIEVLSPCDTLTGISDRIEDYLSLGVPVCWVVDPESGSAWTATASGLTRVTDGILRAGEISMPLADVLD